MGSFSRYKMRRRKGNRGIMKNRQKKEFIRKRNEKCSDGGIC